MNARINFAFSRNPSVRALNLCRMEWLAILIAVVVGLALMANFGFYGLIVAMGALIAWGFWNSTRKHGG